MMRVIFLLLLSSIAFQSNSQTWNNYLQKRFKSYGIWADSILLVPNDTSLNKTGFAIKGSTAYIGDGVKWTAITGGNAGAYDSLLKLNNTWLGVNKFNRQIEVDSLKGAGTLYITGNLETSDDIKAGRRLQAGKSLVRNGIFRFYNFNHNYRTDLQGDSMLTSNVDLLLPSSSGKLALTTDIAPVDTTVVKTVVSARNDSLVLTAAINSKPNFGDVRDIVRDSLLIPKDTLLAHNTRILANQNAINSLDALVVKLGGSQTITGAKTTTNLLTINADNLGTTQDYTKGLMLSNTTAATFSVPNQYSPALVFNSQIYGYTTNSFTGATNGSFPVSWKLEQRPVSGETSIWNNKLVISHKEGNSSWQDIGEFNKDGFTGNLNANIITTGGVGNMGKYQVRRSSNGNVMGSFSAENAGISLLSWFSGFFIFENSVSDIVFQANPNSGTRYKGDKGLFLADYTVANASSASRLAVIGNTTIGENVAAPTNVLS